MPLKLTDIVDYKVTPVGEEGNDHYYFDFVDKNKELTRLEISFKKGYSPFVGDNMNDKWLKEKQPLKLSDIYKKLFKPQELHNNDYF